MRITVKGFIYIIILISLTPALRSQGCSDAGFCTVNSFKPNSTEAGTATLNKIKLGSALGFADHSITIVGSYLEYYRNINAKLGIGAKITSIYQTGNNISEFGLSDIFLNINYGLTESARLTIGTKIPLSAGNKMADNLPLPMDYQSSLGTYDLILGFGYDIGKLQLLTALQQPLTQNKNEFILDDYPQDSPLRSFQSTNNFIRKGDILLRASYPVNIGEKLKLTPSVLPIYHLSDDKYTDASGTSIDIQGSQGLTVNGNAYLDFIIS